MKFLGERAIKCLGLFLLATAVLVPVASGSTIFILSQDGCPGSCGPQAGGFGTVSLLQVDADTVGVTVDLFNGNLFANTANHDALTFNIVGSPVTLSGFTSGFSQDGPLPGNSPFGVFGYGVSCTGCGSNGTAPVPPPLDFVASRASGLSVGDFVANSNAIFFASDILSGTTGKVGAVATSPIGVPAPEPASLVLLSSGLVGTMAIRRKLLPLWKK